MTPTQWIFTFTFGSCVAAAALGAIALRLARGHTLRLAIVITSLVPLLAVAGTVVVSVRVMFLSTHDSGVVLFALAASSLVAVVMAAVAASLVTRSARRVADHVRSMEPGAVVAVVTDDPMPAEFRALVDELETTSARLARAREREHALETSRRELIAFLSHDLRTPLAGIGALAEALEDGVVEDRAIAFGQLRAAVDRMAGIVDDLFTLARVTDPPAPGRRRPVSLVELVGDVTGEVSARAAQNDVALAVEAPAIDRLAVTADADELARAVANLVANAITHTAPGGTVRVQAGRRPDGSILLAVSDACGGIDDDAIGHVFDVGWQAQPARGGGAGLGLAIARGVVEAHAGAIGVRNVGDGCAFEVELPAAGQSGHPVPALRPAANAATPSANEMLERQPS